jgi:hypothetical protein
MKGSDETRVRSDDELVALAKAALTSEGYRVEEVEANSLRMLVAENRYFIVAVVATSTIQQLLLGEDTASRLLQERLIGADVGPKVWDLYLVLLTQERLPNGGEVTRNLFAINYDTRGIRRIVHSGVAPTLTAVRAALTPFVRPVELDDPGIAADPFQSFIYALTERGVDLDTASRAVSAFRQGVSIDDAL